MEAIIYENFWTQDWWIKFKKKGVSKIKICKKLRYAKIWCLLHGIKIKDIVYLH